MAGRSTPLPRWKTVHRFVVSSIPAASAHRWHLCGGGGLLGTVMWILPLQLIPARPCSLSALGSEDSTSPSASRFQALESSVWSRGKALPSIRWSATWKREGWLRRLCGRICTPSTRDRGVALWMESLAATRASRSVLREGSGVRPTSATSGRASQRSLVPSVRLGASLRTSLDTSDWDSELFETIFDQWATRLRRDCLLRQKSARAIRGSGCSSSRLWPTAVAQDDNKSVEAHLAMKARMPGGPRSQITSLNVLVKQWSTPRASPNENRNTRPAPSHGDTHGRTLAGDAVSRQWPTPATRDYKGENGAAHLSAGTGRKHLDQLPNFVRFLFQTSRPDPTISTAGSPCLPITPTSLPQLRLNPRFVEWLMCLPPGWINFEHSEMASWFCRQRSRLRYLLECFEESQTDD